MTQALAPVVEDRRSAALLKAIGLDKVPAEQRELAVAIADRYGLDLMLKHLVIVDGRPYITRDGLLHVAHTSGVFDGIEVTDPTIVDVGSGKFWTARCSVYRKDMTRQFTYAGRYPTSGGNQRFAPEMAVKVSEVMALRRAFDVSAPVIEERWDMDTAPVTQEPAPPPPVAETIRARRAAVATTQAVADDKARPTDTTPVPQAPDPVAEPATESHSSTSVAGEADIVDAVGVEVAPVQCDGFSDHLGRCRKETGHAGPHKNTEGVWP